MGFPHRSAPARVDVIAVEAATEIVYETPLHVSNETLATCPVEHDHPVIRGVVRGREAVPWSRGNPNLE